MTKEERNEMGKERALTNLVIGNLEKAGRNRKRDVKGKPHQFRIGDKILLTTPKLSDLKLKLFH